jgi:hypothetical protein
MRGLAKFGLITVGAGLVLGFGTAGWMHAHRTDVGTRSSPADQRTKSGLSSSPLVLNGSGTNTNSMGDSAELRVTSEGGQGLGQVLGGSGSGAESGTPASGNAGSSSSSGSGGAGGSGADQLPTPSQFHVYDQYKNNATALYIDTKPGTGKAVEKGSVVTMDYRGWLTDGKEFDETYARGKQFTFTEGAGTVIDGFAQAMWGMKAGGQRRLIIPPTVGYGAAGKDPVPPDAVLVFDVELVSVQ